MHIKVLQAKWYTMWKCGKSLVTRQYSSSLVLSKRMVKCLYNCQNCTYCKFYVILHGTSVTVTVMLMQWMVQELYTDKILQLSVWPERAHQYIWYIRGWKPAPTGLTWECTHYCGQLAWLYTTGTVISVRLLAKLQRVHIIAVNLHDCILQPWFSTVIVVNLHDCTLQLWFGRGSWHLVLRVYTSLWSTCMIVRCQLSKC